MAWCVIGRLESGQTQRSVAELLENLLQGCGIDSKKQEMLDVDQGQVGHVPLHLVIHLTARRNRAEKCYAAASK
ncbi:hypothetical protein TNCV_4562501 [Trichonephila clavipes]|nr:hypothetical protein TNCV_4562501 [Trichonephila clavipes]